MKKIKSFFLRNYQRLIRFFILFSAVACIAFSGLTASAETPVYFRYAKPTVTDNSCYLEIAYDNTYYVLYVTGYYDSPDGNKPIGKNFFMCRTLDETNLQLTYYAYGNDGTEMSSYISAFWISSDGRIWSAPYNSSKGRLEFTIGPSTRELVRFYGVDPPWSSSNWGASDIVYVYGEDTIINQKIDLINSTMQSFQGQNQQQLNEILHAIIDNKSSAEKYEYATPDTSNTTQYEQQESAVLDSTASGRTSAIDTMSGLGGLLDNHVGKSLLAMSKLLSEFLDLDWINDIVHFSLVVGLFAFVLGISSIVIMKGLSMRSADRKADTTNLHRPRLPK